MSVGLGQNKLQCVLMGMKEQVTQCHSEEDSCSFNSFWSTRIPHWLPIRHKGKSYIRI